MSKEFSFSVMPSVAISRSRFVRKSQHKTTFNLGEITVLYLDEILPGDTRSIDMASLVRMSTPIAPIMDNIYLDIYAFFVPARLTWIHWKEFMGENNSGAGIPLTTYTIPFINALQTPATNSLADHCGLPVGLTSTQFNNLKVSALPARGIFLIYNRWFRNQNVEAPFAVQTGDTNEVLVGEGGAGCRFNSGSGQLIAYKLPDYFTSALPYAQKGQAVSIPLGTTAPVVALNNSSGSVVAGNTTFNNVGTLLGSTNGQVSATYSTTTAKFVTDLSQATAATINQLRYAFQLQKLLEKDALYGTRYWEILAAHFGVTAPDASLQDPEYLGGRRIHINIDQVLSQSGYDDTSSQEVGKTGANSVTGDKGSLFTKSFVEHGYLYIFAVARHDQTYAQGVNRMWTRSGRYDFYWPVFANLGAQEIKYKEIYAASPNPDGIFGYQEAWAEYRYKPSIASGLLNPNATGALSYWNLANAFTAQPSLGTVFLKQSRENIQRALVTGANGPDFIADFFFQDIAVRPMPMYSIPGLIDHH